MNISEKIVEIPENVKVEVINKKVKVIGPKGTLSKDFSHAPIEILLNNGNVLLSVLWPRKKEHSILGANASQIKNMIKGVKDGFTYKLKAVHAHFPVTIKVQENEKKIVIENFIGEKKPRISKIVGNVDVKISGEEIIIQGMDIQEVSQTAANIEEATRIKGKDQRVFLDGIYISEKK
jgi:large subunit ribosomal protein L6